MKHGRTYSGERFPITRTMRMARDTKLLKQLGLMTYPML